MLKLTVANEKGAALATTQGEPGATLVYEAAYQPGDAILVETDTPGLFLDIRLEDTMLPAIVYLPGISARFEVPTGDTRLAYSPKSFTGEKHLITATVCKGMAPYAYRNLALNPYDGHGDTGMYPHTTANIETRGEAVFASRCTVDGVYANSGHGIWPYTSWGINQRLDAALKLELGRTAEIDEVRLTIRTDFPHDTWWTQATLEFSDGSTEVVALEKTDAPQAFHFAPKAAEWVIVKELIQAEDPSPFPALTQLEVWGTIVE